MFKSKSFSLLLCLILILSSVPVFGFAELMTQDSDVYNDVKPEDWFSEAVSYVTRMNLMNGTSEENKAFSPYSHLTRAMLVTILYRHAGMPELATGQNVFDDMDPNDWFYDAVQWAYENNIAKGMGNNRFDPDLAVTREQAAVFIHRYIKTQSISWIDQNPAVESFIDASDVSSWAKEAVLWCQSNGIFKGTPNHYFNPGLRISRAEIATIVHRFSEQARLYASQPDENEKPSNDKSGTSEDSDDGVIVVSFQSNGGNYIDPVFLKNGSRLTDVPVPEKQDHVFQGWFIDSSLSEPFYSENRLYKDTVLYAGFRLRDYNYKAFVEPTKFLIDQNDSVSFNLISNAALTSNNIMQYVALKDTTTQTSKTDLNIEQLETGVYVLSPASPYVAGRTYDLALLDNSLSFQGEDNGVRSLVFTIEKEEVYDVELQDDIVYLTWTEVQSLEEPDVFEIDEILIENKGITEGKIICITDVKIDGIGVLNSDSRTLRVTNVLDVPGESVYLVTEAATTDDLYDVLDVYLTDELVTEHLVQGFDLDQLKADLKASENTLRFTQLLALAVTESETIQDYAAANSYNQNLTAMLDGLSISASIEVTSNDSFEQVIDNEWIKLTVSFDYQTKINQMDLDATFEFAEYFTLTTGTTMEKYGTKLDAFNVYMDAYSQTEMHFSILVKTASNDGFIDITSEISNLISGLSQDNSSIPTFLEEVLGNRGDYIPIAEIELYKYTYRVQNPVPVLAINFNVKFVVKLNLALGLDAQATLLSARRIGVEGSETGGFFKKYDYALDGDNRQSFDLVCAGYIGLKAGILLDLNVHFVGLEKLGKVGISGEVGVYMDLWGYLKFNLLNDGTMPKPSISMNGGLYMELGIYVEIKLYAVSEIFHAKAELSLLNQKWPFYTLGNQYVVYRFNNSRKTIIMNENELDLKDVLDLEILDLKSGKLNGGDYTQLKDFEIELSHPWFYYHEAYGEKLMVAPDYFGGTKNGVHVPMGTEKLETTLRIHYDGGSLSFSTGYFNEIKIIWIDPSVNPEEVIYDALYTATYQVTLDGIETVVATKTIPAGEVPGSVDLSEWLLFTDIVDYDDAYKEAMWSDKTFNYTLEQLQVFMSYIYWKNNTWHYEKFAVEAGDEFPIPDGYYSTDGMIFKNWIVNDFGLGYGGKDLETAIMQPEDIYYYKEAGFTHTGYETGLPVTIFSGTYEACTDQHFNDYASLATKQAIGVIGNYEPERIEITYVYPSVTLFIYDRVITFTDTLLVSDYYYGSKPVAKARSYPYCVPIGWDADGDGVVDYDYNDLPLVTEAATYRLKVQQDGDYSVTYRTDYGTFSNGEKVIAFEGNYEACKTFMADFDETFEPVILNGYKYTHVGWTEHIGPFSFEYDARWASEPISYSVIFDAGEGAFTVAGDVLQQIEVGYADGESVDFRAIVQPEKNPDVYQTYELTGWMDEEGVVYGLDDTPDVASERIFTAVYTGEDIVYTITVSAGNGTFSDGTQVKTFSGGYLDPVEINLVDPTPPDGVANYYSYEFTGWSADFPDAFTENITIEAVYEKVDYTYEITFDANGGYFDGDALQTERVFIYKYGESVSLPSTPVKPDNGLYGYTFIGWSPDVVAVTENQIYTAQYLTYLLEGEEVGITVSNGIVTEDISVGSLAEYIFDLSGTVPELRITTGSIVTISGVSSELRIRIDETVTEVKLKNLTLAFNGSTNFEALMIDGPGVPLDIVIEGNCVIENQVLDGVALYADREVAFKGIGIEPSLTVEGRAYTLIYTSEDLRFDDMTLNLYAYNGSLETSLAFHDGSGKKVTLSRVVGTFTSESMGFMGCGLVASESSLTIQCLEELGRVSSFLVDNSHISMTGAQGLFVDGFTDIVGGESISIIVDVGPAIRSVSGISVVEVYDLGTMAIVQIDDGAQTYYTFAEPVSGEWVPVSNLYLQAE